MKFDDLALEAPILKALEKQGYTQPTPIQEKAIPILLKGQDLLGVAQTGTGKTAAFGIPILNHLCKDKTSGKGQPKVKALVVTPTRELAIQIAENFTAYSEFTNLKSTVIFGGVKQAQQVKNLRNGVDILIATPGRLLDLMGQGYITFKDLNPPGFSGTSIQNQNEYVDITFDQSIYGDSSATTGLTSSSFTVVQTSGSSLTLNILGFRANNSTTFSSASQL